MDDYKPDAIIRYSQKTGKKKYDFIVEFERTRTPSAIFEEKIRLNEKITNFRKFGLSKQTKFLYMFTTENFDVTTRPVEYIDYKKMIGKVERQFENLMSIVYKLPYYKYRYVMLHEFQDFNKAVLKTPKGNNQ